jgi:hypothetical protein
MIPQLPDRPEHRQALLTCLEFWNKSDTPIEQRSLCFEWIEGPHFERCGERLHQAHLRALEQRGWLTKLDLRRGGARRYYRLTNPALTQGTAPILRMRAMSPRPWTTPFAARR